MILLHNTFSIFGLPSILELKLLEFWAKIIKYSQYLQVKVPNFMKDTQLGKEEQGKAFSSFYVCVLSTFISNQWAIVIRITPRATSRSPTILIQKNAKRLLNQDPPVISFYKHRKCVTHSPALTSLCWSMLKIQR